MNEVDIAWAAGLFEGEGYVGIATSGGYVMQVTSTDLDVLERFQKIIGYGDIRQHSFMKMQTKPAYDWAIRSYQAYEVIKILLPYLGERRTAQAQRVIEKYEYEMRPQTCAHCGETWNPISYRHKTNRIYCDRKCKAQARYLRLRKTMVMA